MSNNNVIEFYSRTGGIFSTLNNLVDQVTKILHAASADGHEYVLDGEVCLLDKDDKDNFAGIMQEITKKNHTIENPSYIIFDLIEKTEFLEANGTTQFIERIEKLEKLDISQYGKYCKMVPNKKSIDVNDFNQ
jgi:ATP-dependent DNA ligase